MFHSVSGLTQGVQVKLWDPLRTRAIPERLDMWSRQGAIQIHVYLTLQPLTFGWCWKYTHFWILPLSTVAPNKVVSGFWVLELCESDVWWCNEKPRFIGTAVSQVTVYRRQWSVLPPTTHLPRTLVYSTATSAAPYFCNSIYNLLHLSLFKITRLHFWFASKPLQRIHLFADFHQKTPNVLNFVRTAVSTFWW